VPVQATAPPATRPRRTCAAEAESLYAAHAARVHRYCRRFLRDDSEAEDALQTTFMYALRALHRGVKPEFESAWLLAIARNVCLSRTKNSDRRRRFEITRDVQVLDETTASAERFPEEMIRLEEALLELPEVQQRVILLREWQGLSYREIAGMLGVSLAAVETHIFRARRALAELLEEDVPLKKRRPRLAHLNAGSWLIWLKTAFGPASAMKAGAAIAALAGGIAIGAGGLHEARSGQASQAISPRPSPDAAAFDRSGTTPLKTRAHKATKAGQRSPTPRLEAVPRSDVLRAADATTETISTLSAPVSEELAMLKRELERVHVPSPPDPTPGLPDRA
jgi:RNA polymerase sigma factor (sigma-70 family)